MTDEARWTAALRPAADREAFRVAVAQYMATLRSNYASLTQAQPEDQLKSPVGALVKVAGEFDEHTVVFRTETKVDGIAGRPDLGFDLDSLPMGNVELKAPGLGANPAVLDKRSRDQWERFKALPNLIYTDGSDWALFRSGVRVGQPVKLGASVTWGDERVEDWAADALLGLLTEFFHWQPNLPHNAKALAQMLAPLTGLLRDEVLQDVTENGILASLAGEWRSTLFPDATDQEFADGYAQTFTYALLLARLEGAADPLSAETAAKELDGDHALLGQALRVIGQASIRKAIELPVSLLERVISAVDADKLTKSSDPWLYFYEDFLAAYDPAQRNNRGVYYTPVPVVAFQVRTAHSVLSNRLGKSDGIGDDSVTVLDPAAGTGTYPLAVTALALHEAEKAHGSGFAVEVASRLATNLNAFEILVGPYAVTHLRLSRALTDAQASVPTEGVRVFLTDTLAEPAMDGFAAQVNIFERKLAEEQERASKVKSPATHVTVVMGNPPYDRDASGESGERRKGGMVRHRTSHGDDPLIQGFLDPMTTRARGEHAMNLYNDYVYFWRWSIWKVCEQNSGPGIVSFITPNAFYTGEAFTGMRQVMRERFDEIWALDLGGDARGTSGAVDDNVFDIQTPVSITVCVRLPDDEHSSDAPATLRYRRIEGSRAEKFAALDAESDLVPSALWREGPSGWHDPFVPEGTEAYATWPRLRRIFPWSSRGMQFSRTWPVSESRDILTQRWQTFVDASILDRPDLLHQSRDSRVDATPTGLFNGKRLERLDSLSTTDQPEAYKRIGFRSFDRQWALADYRLIDMPRRSLWDCYSEQQVYFTTVDDETTDGPAIVAQGFVPDLNSHNNRGGLAYPLYRDAGATAANVAEGLLSTLGALWGEAPTAEEVAGYVYAIAGSDALSRVFADHMRESHLRIPVTTDHDLFRQGAELGRDLVWWTTFAARTLEFDGTQPLAKKLPAAAAKITTPIQGPIHPYPESFSYNSETKVLTLGAGSIEPVSHEVWDYAVSGYPVVQSWLRYRMRNRAGKRSSALDDIRPDRWGFSSELLEVLAAVEHLVSTRDETDAYLHSVLETVLLTKDQFPKPTDAEVSEPPKPSGPSLFDHL